jgi:hypothetical protein
MTASSATQLSLEEVKALHEIVTSEDDGLDWLMDRMKELKADIPQGDYSQRTNKDLQAIKELQWRETVALVNLALRLHSP